MPNGQQGIFQGNRYTNDPSKCVQAYSCMGTWATYKLHRSIAVSGDCDSAEIDESCLSCKQIRFIFELLQNFLSWQLCSGSNTGWLFSFSRKTVTQKPTIAVHTETTWTDCHRPHVWSRDTYTAIMRCLSNRSLAKATIIEPAARVAPVNIERAKYPPLATSWPAMGVPTRTLLNQGQFHHHSNKLRKDGR